jgi:hypothetical protein
VRTLWHVPHHLGLWPWAACGLLHSFWLCLLLLVELLLLSCSVQDGTRWTCTACAARAVSPWLLLLPLCILRPGRLLCRQGLCLRPLLLLLHTVSRTVPLLLPQLL